MENVIHRLTLDLTGPDTIPRVEVQQDNARTLVISLTQGGRPYWIAEGVTAVFSARKPDGNPLFNGCTIEKNRVRYDFTDQTTNVAGIVECEILLYSGDERILASPRFELAIDELIHKDGDVPESAPEISALTQMVAAGTAMIEDLREALGELEGVEEILNQARAAVDTARGHAHDAGVSSGEASTAATAASSAATAASQSAQTAGEHADAAKTEAQKASSAANAVGSAVVAAREQADRAEAARTAAEQAEQAAGAAAATATQEAGGAAQSARDAETYAGQALSAKSYAEQATFEAKGYAQTAHDAAGAASALRGDAEYSAQSASKSAQGAEEAADRAEAAAARAEAAGGTGGGGGADLTGYATEDWVRQGYQPKGSYLTEDMLDSAIEDALDEAATSGKFDGEDGAPGRGIKTIARTAGNGAAGTVDTYTITYTDGTKSTYQVRNGANGTNGKTPVKGTDYFTDADKAELVSAVIEALPKYAGEVSAV